MPHTLDRSVGSRPPIAALARTLRGRFLNGLLVLDSRRFQPSLFRMQCPSCHREQDVAEAGKTGCLFGLHRHKSDRPLQRRRRRERIASSPSPAVNSVRLAQKELFQADV